MINNGHCVNNHQINNSNIENNLNKKSKSTDNDYESKQSLIKILSQHQTENSGMLHSSQVDSEVKKVYYYYYYYYYYHKIILIFFFSS